MIPNIIHQTWKDENIPDKWIDSVNSCKRVYSDFTYMLWTDEKMEEFIKTKYPWFYETYMGYPHDIQRCDAFRYFVLYTYGGIYLDLDITCLKDLNDFLKYDTVLVKSMNFSSSYTNSFFMSSKGNPFFKFCMEHLETYKKSNAMFGKHMHVMNSAGPVFLTRMVKKYGTIENVRILSNQEFAGNCTVCNDTKGCKGGEYFSHVEGMSWVSWDTRLYTYILCNYKSILLLIILVFIYFVI